MSPQLEILLIGVITAASCALPGAFLILRGMSMMADSITHTVLLGIVLAFFVTGDLNSPLLLIGATLMGLFTVYSTESLKKTRLLSEEASLGVVFPLLFSIAIILITKYSGSVHIDTDAVLLGELAFAPFDRMVVFGMDIGASAIYTSGAAFIINAVVISLFFKELKVSTFDPLFASVSGLHPTPVHYVLMTLVSFTAVSAFESAGSVLVIAFMIVPGASAYLITHKLSRMLMLSALFGAVSAALGFFAAYALDVSIAGSMAVCAGVIFALVFLFAPKSGLISGSISLRRQKRRFAEDILLIRLRSMQFEVLCHAPRDVRRTVRRLLKGKYIFAKGGMLELTDKGRARAERAYSEAGSE